MPVAERTKKLAKDFATNEPADENDNAGFTGRVIVEWDEYQAARTIVLLWLLENNTKEIHMTEDKKDAWLRALERDAKRWRFVRMHPSVTCTLSTLDNDTQEAAEAADAEIDRRIKEFEDAKLID